jgi:hypothetical protein
MKEERSKDFVGFFFGVHVGLAQILLNPHLRRKLTFLPKTSLSPFKVIKMSVLESCA